MMSQHTNGDMRRANGLVARFRRVLHEDGHSVLLYNLLMKGYTKTDFPLDALTIRDEMLRRGLKPDKLTYNTLIFACIRHGRVDIAIQLLAEMKVLRKYKRGQFKAVQISFPMSQKYVQFT
ncbi:hypothetical protein COCNU_contig69311863G000010 [Cocos nucifera]|nr:hypothetical protein [Cocos nucifera]